MKWLVRIFDGVESVIVIVFHFPSKGRGSLVAPPKVALIGRWVPFQSLCPLDADLNRYIKMMYSEITQTTPNYFHILTGRVYAVHIQHALDGL